jgi:protein-tyrosine-phosphatase
MRVIVVCHGNRYRSPFAAGLIRHLKHGWDVRSRGVKQPIGNHKAARPARAAAEVRGFSLENHCSKLISNTDVRWADTVLYMDGGNRRRLIEMFGEKEHFRCLASSINEERIPDPAFLTGKFQLEIWDMLERACRALILDPPQETQ